MTKPKILIAEDEMNLREVLRFQLTTAGYEVVEAEDGRQAVERAREVMPDLLLLDVMMPHMDGFQVARELRKSFLTRHIPIIMLTAKAAEIDRVLGLELGADDYVTKPFSPRELVLRVKRLLRSGTATEEKSDHIVWKELSIDVPRHQVTVKGKSVDLTATEFKLLTVLAQRRGRVQSREQLLHDVWEYDNLIDTRTVDTHMRRLREKVGPAAKYLDTVRGVGYRFVEE